MNIRQWRLRPVRSYVRLAPWASWPRPLSTSADPDPDAFNEIVQLLEGISHRTEQGAFRAAVVTAVKLRYPLCRFYGPMAQYLSHSACDPEVVCVLYEQLQIGHKVEMYLPGRAWLVDLLCKQVTENDKQFTPQFTDRLAKLTFLSDTFVLPTVARLYALHQDNFQVGGVCSMLSMAKKSSVYTADCASIVETTAQIVQRWNGLPATAVDIEAENEFIRRIFRFFEGRSMSSPEERLLRRVVAARLRLLSAVRVPNSQGVLISHQTVCTALARMGSASSEDAGVREVLQGLLAGRERDEIETILIGVAPPLSVPPPPPLAPMDTARDTVRSIPATRIRGMDIFSAISGLKEMHSKHQEVRACVSFLCYELSMLLESGDEVAVDDTLFLGGISGMRNFQSDVIAVRRLLASVLRCTVIPSPPGRRVNMIKKISNAVSGLRKMNGEQDEVIAVLKALAPIISRFTRDGFNRSTGLPSLGERDTLFLLAGLRAFDSDSEVVGDYMRSLSVLLANQKKLALSAQGAAVVLYALRSCDSGSDAVRALLRPLSTALDRCEDVLTPRQISMCLAGLHSMSTVYPEVLRLVSILTKFVNGSDGCLNSQGVAMCLSGLRYMSHRHPEVRSLLAAVIKKIGVDSRLVLRSQELGMALSGLQSMSSECAEVCTLISLLCTGATNCTEPLTAQGISMCMQGFRLWSSDHEAVRGMITALTRLIENSPDAVLTEQGVVLTVKNMRYLNSDHEEVRQLLAVLTPKLEQSREALDPVDFLNCMRGLKAMSSDWVEVRDLFDVLRGKIPPALGEMWWQEIFRSNVFDTQELLEDLRHYSRLNSNFYNILSYVLHDERGIVKRVLRQEESRFEPIRVPSNN